jgi:hypothetical protein
MRSYRIVKDNFAGYEAQVKYDWFPFMWFQANDFHWINTWETPEQAEAFIQCKKQGMNKCIIEEPASEYEFEKESKLLFFKMKDFSPEVVWEDPKPLAKEAARRKWWPAFNLQNG